MPCLKVGKRTTLRFSSIYSEIELTPPSVSQLENSGLVKSSAEVAAVITGCIVQKVVKDFICCDNEKYLIFNPEAESFFAFEYFAIFRLCLVVG